jgi:hypothetical protein
LLAISADRANLIAAEPRGLAAILTEATVHD